MLKPILKASASMLASSKRMPGRSWKTEMFCRVLKDLFVTGNNLDVATFRAMVAKPIAHPSLKKVSRVKQSVGSVPCTMVRPNKGGDAKRVIVYLHGGGYVVGAPSGHFSVICELAVGSDCLVVAPDYRLAPEHPFPAPQDDCLAVVRAVIKAYEDCQIIIAGDSAGGGLTLATELSLQNEGGRSADGLILISPWVDPQAADGTIISNADNDFLAKEFLDKSMSALMQGHSLEDPKVNFTQVDLSNLPPTLVQYGSGEVFADQIRHFCARAKAEGVALTEQSYRAQFHVFQILSGVLKDGKIAMQAMHQFVTSLPARKTKV